MKTGVYAIRNKMNTKIYIGSASVSLKRRFRDHQRKLRCGTHRNSHLQFAWNRYGEENFEFIVIETCKPEDCIVLEQYWMDYYESYLPQNGYNICPTAGNMLGYKMSEESKLKTSISNKGRSFTEEHKLNLSIARVGMKLSKEHKVKISQSLKGNKRALGLKHTLESREKMTFSRLGKKRGRYKRQKTVLFD